MPAHELLEELIAFLRSAKACVMVGPEKGYDSRVLVLAVEDRNQHGANYPHDEDFTFDVSEIDALIHVLTVTENRYKRRTRVPKLEAPIVAIIKARGPMKMKALLEHLTKSEVKINGKKPMSTLSAHVSYLVRTDRLNRNDDGVLSLKAPQ